MLPNNHTLAHYGLGSMFQNWQLQVVRPDAGTYTHLLTETDFLRDNSRTYQILIQEERKKAPKYVLPSAATDNH